MPFKVNKLSLLGGLSLTAIAVLVALPYLGANNAMADSGSSGTIAFNPETDLVPENARCTTNAYIDSSTRTVKADDMDYRQSATSVSIPFKGTTDDEVTKEIVSEICGNPTVLKMVADDMMLWTGFPGAEENKKVWLQELVDDLNTNGLDSFIQKDPKDGTLIVSEKLVMYAGWFNTVLLDSESEGKQSLHSMSNWEVPLMASPKTQPVAALAADQEKKPAWVRSFYDKNDKCLYRIGFNAEDKRLETFNCATPEETPPAETPPAETPNPGCTTNCGETPPKENPPKETPPKENPPKENPPKPKNKVVDPPATQGTTPLVEDAVQPVAPPAKAKPLDPATPVTESTETTAPGATPAPPAPAPAPSIPEEQQPTPDDLGTPITDPDG